MLQMCDDEKPRSAYNLSSSASFLRLKNSFNNSLNYASLSILSFQVAIKIIDVAQDKKDYVMKNLTREAKVLSMLQHPSIVRLYETIRVSRNTFRESL